MKEKLTLSINKHTKQQAKRYAKQNGTSISQMVETFLDSVTYRKNEDWHPPEGSVVAKILGSVSNADERDYKEIIEEEIIKKHG